MNERTLDTWEYIAMSDRNGEARMRKVMSGFRARDERKMERRRSSIPAKVRERVDAIVHRINGRAPWYGDGTNPDEIAQGMKQYRRRNPEAEEPGRREAAERQSAALVRLLVGERKRKKQRKKQKRRAADRAAGVPVDIGSIARRMGWKRGSVSVTVAPDGAVVARGIPRQEHLMSKASKRFRRDREREAEKLTRQIIREELGPEAPAAAVKEITKDMIGKGTLKTDGVKAVVAIREQGGARIMGFGAEVTGVEWQQGKEYIDILRTLGESWTRISRVMSDDGNPGFAKSAYDSKHVMTRKAVERLQEFVAAIDATVVAGARQVLARERAGMTNKPEDLNVKDNPRFPRMKALYDELRRLGITVDRIAKEGFGYAHGPTLHQTLQRRGDPGEERIAKAEAFLQSVRDEIKGRHRAALEAATTAATEPPPSPVEPEKAPEPTPAEAITAARVREAVAAESLDPFAWMTEVQDGLMEIMSRVERHRDRAPKILRGSYNEAIGKIVTLAAEFER